MSGYTAGLKAKSPTKPGFPSLGNILACLPSVPPQKAANPESIWMPCSSLQATRITDGVSLEDKPNMCMSLLNEVIPSQDKQKAIRSHFTWLSLASFFFIDLVFVMIHPFFNPLLFCTTHAFGDSAGTHGGSFRPCQM